MKTFYQITSEGFNLMVKLDIMLDTAAEFEISEEFITGALNYEHDNLHTIWNEWHDMEFCDRDLPNVLSENRIGDLLQRLVNAGLIKETYTDND